MAFRLSSVQKLLSEKQLPSHLLATRILRQAVGLGYGHHCFLVLLQCVDTSPLSDFYQSLLNAWQSLSVCRQQDTYVNKIFAQEPLFFNPLFPSIPRIWDFCQHFIRASITKVWHLQHVSGCRWKSAQEIADLMGTWSKRVIRKVLREVI